MHPNWLGILAAVLAIAAYFGAHRLAIKPSSRQRLYWLAPAILSAIPGASFALYYAHLYDETIWYSEFRSVLGTEFLLIFVGLAGGLLAAMMPRRLQIIALSVTAGLLLIPFAKPFIGPIPSDKLIDKWKDGICLQSTPSTCGPASMASILTFLGQNITESELAREAHSYMGGTEAWYLARAARSRGFVVRFRKSTDFSSLLTLPTVIGVKIGSFGHFIPILSREGDDFLIGDPLRGREIVSKAQLLARYQFTGFNMEIAKE